MKTLKNKIISIILGLFLISSISFAQGSGIIKGNIINEETNEAVPFATIFIKIGDKIQGCTSDEEGYFTLKPVPVGKHQVHFKSMGYQEVIITEVNIDSDKISFLNNVKMKNDLHNLRAAVVSGEKYDMFDPDNPSQKVMRSKQIEKLPNNNNLPAMLAVISTDFQVSDNNKDIHVRGARKNDMALYIDGVRQMSTEMNIPGRAIGSIIAYSGGVPAKYGDFTGGVVVIETKSYFDWLAEQESKRLSRR